ncbi:Phage XkdN-like tail assembly chaperone protein, TAC [Eubacterium pyruvativorans]|nr:Phage XkdN-like tail assembly chaperone protein, TAC [Eubacterium pyruvativorans]
MSDLSLFMRSNKKERANAKFAVTKSLCDHDGNPLEWTIRPLTTEENNEIMDDCTRDVKVPGKPNMFRPKLDNQKYLVRLMCASVVEPNLNDKALQDSYDAGDAWELLTRMVDNPGEFSEFGEFLQAFNGFAPLEEDVEKAKNS